jgi:hypothetical protein
VVVVVVSAKAVKTPSLDKHRRSHLKPFWVAINQLKEGRTSRDNNETTINERFNTKYISINSVVTHRSDRFGTPGGRPNRRRAVSIPPRGGGNDISS